MPNSTDGQMQKHQGQKTVTHTSVSRTDQIVERQEQGN